MEIGDWLTHFEQAPNTVFVTHGEMAAADHMRQVIERRFGWNVVVPELGQEVELN
jgi:metallo-beta-lactamase family protein